MNVLITGTSRGIGLSLTEQALAAEANVIAIARNPRDSKGLQDLKAKFEERLNIIEADLMESKSIEVITHAVKSQGGLDILINNAGIMRPGETMDDFMESFKVNSVVPYMLTTALKPYLQKSKDAKAAHISSLMGSVQDNSGGGYYTYRASKAALNMINKSLSIDLPWLTTLVLHPGWVQTDMGGSNAPVQPEQSAKGIWQLIDQANKEQSGQFYDFRGKNLPW